MPKKFLFDWNVFLDMKAYKVEFEGGKLIIGEGAFRNHIKIIQPSSREWADFWLKIDKIGIWDWKSDYTDFNVLDGYSWCLYIVKGNNSVKTVGSNRHPNNFLAFIEALEDLLKTKLDIIKNYFL